MEEGDKMGAKTRGNYTTGGWCNLRTICTKDGKKCDECFRYSEFKEKGQPNDK